MVTTALKGTQNYRCGARKTDTTGVETDVSFATGKPTSSRGLHGVREKPLGVSIGEIG